jgi:hypothetical protein
VTFLQPILLVALPLAALPILIHLWNRRRYRTVPWAAMMFLLDARRMTQGMARLRFWLIMLARILAITALILAASRPLATGRLGIALGGQAETTLLILDRSASMGQRAPQTNESKRATSLLKLAEWIREMNRGTRLLLIENTEPRIQPVDLPESLPELPGASDTSTTADLPSMLQVALDHLVVNQVGRTDVWICSDLRISDWKPGDSRWVDLRAGFAQLPGVRFYLLTYAEPALGNLSVRAEQVKRRQTETGAELSLDVTLTRDPSRTGTQTVPLEFDIQGARSVLNVELSDAEFTWQGHTISLDAAVTEGWGRVVLPQDSNPLDDIYYFAFGPSPVRQTVIVADEADQARLLRLAAISPLDPGLDYSARIWSPREFGQIDTTATSLILWAAPLPTGAAARLLEEFVAQARPVIFFPAQNRSGDSLFGLEWPNWQTAPPGQSLPIATWRGDSDLLGHTQSGKALPVGRVRTFRYCPPAGHGTVLARLAGGAPWLTRAVESPGPVYFCATLPGGGYSNLAQEGVVLYAMLQRALSEGIASQGPTRQISAGTPAAREVTGWQLRSQLPADVPPSSRWLHAAVFQQEEQWIALNRPAEEDLPATLSDDALQQLFAGLDYRRVEDRAGSTAPLASEIWRGFLLIMAGVLLLEAWLCLPEVRTPPA